MFVLFGDEFCVLGCSLQLFDLRKLPKMQKKCGPKHKKWFLLAYFLYKLIKTDRLGDFVALLVLSDWLKSAKWGLLVLFNVVNFLLPASDCLLKSYLYPVQI